MTEPDPQPDAASDAVSPICSARGCRESATWVLAWNNPKLHAPQRRKAWTACDEHRAQLSEFLQARGFLRETERVEDYGGASAADR